MYFFLDFDQSKSSIAESEEDFFTFGFDISDNLSNFSKILKPFPTDYTSFFISLNFHYFFEY